MRGFSPLEVIVLFPLGYLMPLTFSRHFNTLPNVFKEMEKKKNRRTF
jgi:hypothetical protein